MAPGRRAVKGDHVHQPRQRGVAGGVAGSVNRATHTVDETTRRSDSEPNMASPWPQPLVGAPVGTIPFQTIETR